MMDALTCSTNFLSFLDSLKYPQDNIRPWQKHVNAVGWTQTGTGRGSFVTMRFRTVKHPHAQRND